jgi:tyrosinase
VEDSPFFKDFSPTSGLGGWGDPSRDFEVSKGGFSNLSLSYPSVHRLSRKFTLRPGMTIDSPFITNRELMANSTFTEAEVNKMVKGFKGDFKGFQTYFEGFSVRFTSFPSAPWIHADDCKMCSVIGGAREHSSHVWRVIPLF